MSENSYIEPVFVEFYDRNHNISNLNFQDFKILTDFYNKVSFGDQLTANQGNYLIRLMSKYLPLSIKNGFDYSETLKNPVWKTTFRTLDYSKEAFCEKDSEGLIWAYLKFPFVFKDKYEKEFENATKVRSSWDHDRKLRKLDLQKYNIIHLYEFIASNGFNIQESFMEAVFQAEEAWNEQDSIIPYAVVVDNKVVLKNATADATAFWESTASGDLNKDMFLAKSMGYVVKMSVPPSTVVENIASTVDTDFWFKDVSKFFELYASLDCYVGIVIDRNTQDVVGWLDEFVKKADFCGISRSDIKVCFRETESRPSALNKWIKDNNVGGTVKDGKILIFQHKPPKWLFKEDTDVKIIATNSFTPMNEPLTSAWVAAHPCVCYLGGIKPTRARDKKIVEL